MTHLHVGPRLGDVGVPVLDLRDLRSAEWHAATTDSRPLLRGYRPQHYDNVFDYRTVDYEGDGHRLLLDLRPHLRPVRRRQHPARLHAGPHGGPQERDRPPRRSRLRDRRRRHLHDAPARGRPEPPRPLDRHHVAPLAARSCQLFHRQYPQAVIVARARPRALADARREVRVSGGGGGRLARRPAGTWRSVGAPIPSRSDLITPRRPFSSSAVYISLHALEDLPGDLELLLAGRLRRRPSKLIGSPNCTVTFGKRSLRHLRTPSEPWIATGITGTPDSSAIRPTPGRGSPEPAASRAPALRVHQQAAAAIEDRVGGLERLLVVVAAADREGAAVPEDVLDHRVREQLGLGHEADLPAQVDGGEEVVHLAEVVRGQDHRPRGGHVLGADRPGPVEEQASAASG